MSEAKLLVTCEDCGTKFSPPPCLCEEWLETIRYLAELKYLDEQRAFWSATDPFGEGSTA